MQSYFTSEYSPVGLTSHNSKVFVGQFFEDLTHHIISGSVLADIKEDEANPDLIVWNNKAQPFDILLEVKASMRAHLFDKNQIGYYNDLKGNAFPYTRPKMYYVLWCYHFKGNVSMAGSASNLIKMLGKMINICYIVPIEIIHLIIKYLPARSYGLWSTDKRQFYYRMPRKVFDILSAGSLRGMTEAILSISNNVEDISSKYQINEFKIPQLKLGYCITKPFSIFTVSDVDWKPLIKGAIV